VKFLADEDVDKPIVERLRKDSHIVFYVIEMEPGISDDEVIQRANQESALLLTADKDFGELVFRQGRIVYNPSGRIVTAAQGRGSCRSGSRAF